MKALRFTGLLAWRVILAPLAGAFALVPLAIAWVLLATVLFVWTTWRAA